MEDDNARLGEEIELYGSHVQRVDLVVNLLALLQIIYGILAILTASSVMALGIYESPLIVTLIYLTDIVVLIIALPLFIIIGWGIWSLQPWVWKIAVMTNIIYLILTLLGSIVLLTILNIIIILILYSTDVVLALSSEDSQVRDR